MDFNFADAITELLNAPQTPKKALLEHIQKGFEAGWIDKREARRRREEVESCEE